jgi:hypothetical protein
LLAARWRGVGFDERPRPRAFRQWKRPNRIDGRPVIAEPPFGASTIAPPRCVVHPNSRRRWWLVATRAEARRDVIAEDAITEDADQQDERAHTISRPVGTGSSTAVPAMIDTVGGCDREREQ